MAMKKRRKAGRPGTIGHREPVVLRLPLHDAGQAEGTRQDHGHERRQQDGNAVGHGLGDGPHPTDEGELVVARPPRHERGDDGQPADGQDVEHADVEIRGEGRAAEGDDGRHGQRNHRRQQRSEIEQRAIGPRRDDVLLLEQLHDVGDRLEQAHGPDEGGAQTRLHAAGELALEPDPERDDGEHQRGDDGAVRRAVREGRHRSTSPMMGSSEPRMATASLMVWPGRM
jgi:hypothetical protein